jgi:protein N-terminal amidase
MDKSEKINVLIFQYSPQFKEKEKNFEYIKLRLLQYKNKDIDIILFPEMSFTGYIFDDRNDILPMCEKCEEKSISFSFAKSISESFNDAYVVFGYPELGEDDSLFNSAAIVSSSQGVVYNSRKKHLYYDDQRWASEGKDFGYTVLNIKGIDVKVCLGICMDINPYQFTAPWEDFEFGNFCKEKDCDLILFLTNWLLDDQNNDKEEREKSIQLINYWLARLEPVLCQKTGKKQFFIVSNRNGTEKGKDFSGCSSVYSIKNKKTNLLSFLNKKAQGEIYFEIKKKTY